MSTFRLQGEIEKTRGIYYEVDPSEPPIGIGGMGRVYKGICYNQKTRETKPVAIKFMFEDLPDHAIERARREASIQLRNDNLVEMLGFIETESLDENGLSQKHYHVVSELLHGVCLTDFLKGTVTDRKDKEIPFISEMQNLYKTQKVDFAKKIVKSVLSGLMALHDAGYIHRDIDPSNIMLTSDGHIKLLDFGIACKIGQITDDDSSTKESLVGKPKYAAPELIGGNISQQNQTTDIYAVGILLYQLLCGHLPFEGSMVDVIQMQKTNNVPVSDIEDYGMRLIVKKATEKQQEKRYQSASEFRVALDAPAPKDNSMAIFIVVVAVICVLGVLLGVLLAVLL